VQLILQAREDQAKKIIQDMTKHMHNIITNIPSEIAEMSVEEYLRSMQKVLVTPNNIASEVSLKVNLH